MSKPKLIIFEGVDGSGKTSLKNSFNISTEFRHYVVDRLFVSNYVYNSKYQRDVGDDISYYVDVFKDLSKLFDIVIVYCYAGYSVIRTRRRVGFDEYSNDVRLFSELLRVLSASGSVTMVSVNTGVLTYRDCLNKVLKVTGDWNE